MAEDPTHGLECSKWCPESPSLSDPHDQTARLFWEAVGLLVAEKEEAEQASRESGSLCSAQSYLDRSVYLVNFCRL